MSKNRKIREASEGTPPTGSDRRREVIGVIGLGAALFLLVAMVSLQAGRLVMGPFGRASAGMYYGLAGVCGYLLIAPQHQLFVIGTDKSRTGHRVRLASLWWGTQPTKSSVKRRFFVGRVPDPAHQTFVDAVNLGNFKDCCGRATPLAEPPRSQFTVPTQ